MAKKRLRIKDSSGNVVPYDVSAADVTLQDGTNVETAISGLGAGTVKGVKMNNTVMPENNGIVDLGNVVTEHQSLAPLFGKVAYDSATRRINFFGKDDVMMSNVLGWIDASPFIVDGFLSSVDVKNVTISGTSTLCMVFSFNTDAGMQDINVPVSAIFDASQYYTKGQADETFQVKLASGTNIKTINNESVLGEGNISIPSGDDGKSAYQSYVDTTDDNPVMTEEEWSQAILRSAYLSYLATTSDNPKKTEAEWVASLKGEKGDTGNVQVDGNGNVLIVNDLTTGGSGAALSARQGKILKSAVDQVQANLQAVLDALANMAFTGDKPTLTPIDWTGGTFYATIVKSLTGCSATDNTTNGQIAEGSTLAMQLTASSGYTLTGATISVTDSRGQYVAYTLNGSTLSVANVMGTITISVVAKAVYSVANNDAHVDMTTQTPNPVAGSSWSGTLSLKSGVTGYALSSNPSVTMGGVAVDLTASGNSWNRSTGAMTIGNVTGDIVILEAAVEVVAHTVTKKLLNMTSSNTTGDTTDPDFGYKKQSVEDGGSYTTTLAAATGATSNNDVVVKMGGVDITSTAYDSSTGEVNIAEVTGDVTIIATAATGVIKVTGNAAVTGGVNINGTSYDIASGEVTLNADIKSITSFSLTNDGRTALTAIDFGGAKYSASLGDVFGNYTNPKATSLVSVKGLVLNGTNGGNGISMSDSFAGCSSLTELETIGWTAKVTGLGNYSSTLLTALDLEDLDASLVTAMAINIATLTELRLPNLPALTNGHYGVRNCAALTKVVIRGGSGLTKMDYMFSSCAALQLVDISGLTITSSMTDFTQIFNDSNSNITLKVGVCDWSAASGWGENTDGLNKVKTLICTTNDPSNVNVLSKMSQITAIYVPDAAVSAYQTAWSDKASIIHSINDYNA